MAVVEAQERHEHLVEELIADVEAYKPGRRRGPAAPRVRVRRARARRSAPPLGRGVHPSSLGRGEDPRDAAPRRADAWQPRSCTTSSRTRSRDIADVKAEFGDEIARLVEGVTKLTRIQFASREHAEVENYRKMIVAMAQDPRVILIKLADRLHNMRTIEYLGARSSSRRRRRRSRSMRRSRTGSASTPSSGSSKTSRSSACIRASTRRSRRWSRSAGATARST